MSTVNINSYLRLNDGHFIPFDDVDSYSGDCQYVPGAIVFAIGSVEVLSLALWDDINWLWPYVVQALDECRRNGHGQRFFPDQPLRFRAEALGSSGQLLVSVKGGAINNRAVGPAHDIYVEAARAALAFFADLHRVCPAAGLIDGDIIETAKSWKSPG